MRDDPLNRTKVMRGSQLPHAKLTEADVEKIHELVKIRRELEAIRKKLTNKAIAEAAGVHQRSVDRIIAGYNWTHVNGWIE